MSKQKLPIKREFSAGGCVYKRVGGDVVWLVGKHSGYHKWVLPKGLIEKGEKGIETAVRETKEEMGVVARVVEEKPIHKEEYWFVATLADKSYELPNFAKASRGRRVTSQEKKPIRRVEVYQEEPEFEKAGGDKVRVFKTVSFYLMEYVSGDPKDHDWEMSEAGWCGFEEAGNKLAFEGERQALEKARVKVS
jgi:8-oxo-dGTP pyrophosphatase MutT (NUDIX family)